jgi:ankyrin repeat protein
MKKSIALSLALLSTSLFADTYDNIATGFIKYNQVDKEISLKEEIKENNNIVGYIYHLKNGGYLVVTTNPNSSPIKTYSFIGSYNNLPAAYKNFIKSDLSKAYNLLGGTTGVITANDAVLNSTPDTVSSTDSSDVKINTEEVEKNNSKWNLLNNLITDKVEDIKSVPPTTVNNPVVIENEEILNNTTIEPSKFEPAKEKLLYESVDPLMDLTWDQNPLYNSLFPELNGSFALTGCVQTATGQVIAHNRYPSVGEGFAMYNAKVNSSGNYPLFADFTRTLNFDNMPTELTSSSLESDINEVAHLMLDLAVAHSAILGTSETGALSVFPALSLTNYYKYSTSIAQANDGDSNFLDVIKSNIDEGYPILLSVPGHMTVLDGYNYGELGNQIHINMGWGGLANAFYTYDQTIETGTSLNFAPNLDIIYNIKPCVGDDCASYQDVADSYDYDAQLITGNLDWKYDIDTYEVYLKGDTSIDVVDFKTPVFTHLFDSDGNVVTSSSSYTGLSASGLTAGKYKVKFATYHLLQNSNYSRYYDDSITNNYAFSISTTALTPGEKAVIDGVNTPPEIRNVETNLEVNGVYNLVLSIYDREADSVSSITAVSSDTSKLTTSVDLATKMVTLTALEVGATPTVTVTVETADGQTATKTFNTNIVSLSGAGSDEGESESLLTYSGDLSIGNEVTFKLNQTEFGGFPIAKYYFDSGNGEYVEVKPVDGVFKHIYLVPGQKNVNLEVVNTQKGSQIHSATLEISDLTEEQKAAYKAASNFYCEQNPSMCLTPELVSASDFIINNRLSVIGNQIVNALAIGDYDTAKTLYETYKSNELPAKNGVRPLAESIKKDPARASDLIANGANINVQDDKKGLTPLHVAVAAKQYDLIEELLDAGADTNFLEYKKGLTPLDYAVSKGDPLALQAFINAGYNIDELDINGEALLHKAVKLKKMKQLTQFFLDNNANLNVKNIEGQTIAHLLVGLKDTGTMELLIPEGLNLGAVDNYGQNVMNYYYFSKSPVSKVKDFLEAHGITEANAFADGKTILHVFAEYGNSKGIGSKTLNPEIINLINERDVNGRTPLHYLAQTGDTKIMELLVNSGVDINAVDVDGNTPLILAAIASKKVKIAKQIFNKAKPNGKKSVTELIDFGADVSIANTQGKTALHYVVEAAEKKGIDALVKAGADKEAKDNDGHTPFLLTAMSDTAVKSVKTLMKIGGFNLSAKNNNGQNITHLACGSWVEDINAYNKKTIKAVYKPSSVLKDLIKADPSLAMTLMDAKDNFGKTSLMYALQTDNTKALATLVKAGADLDVSDSDGLGLLGYGYLYSKDYKSIATLQKAGLTNFAQTGDKWYWTISNKFDKVFLKEGSATYKMLDTTGNFPIHYAAALGKKGMGDISKMVTKYGINVNLQNIHTGKTALHYIAQSGEVKGVQTLIEKLGADKDIQDKDGRTALYYAFLSGEQEVFEYLLALE